MDTSHNKLKDLDIGFFQERGSGGAYGNEFAEIQR